MIANSLQCLEEATALALLLVDQIRWVDLLDEKQTAEVGHWVREDGIFCRGASAWVRRPRVRDALKAVVEKMAQKTASSPLALKMLSPHEVEAACGLLTSALKGLLLAEFRGNDFLRTGRLILSFESIESPWIQDPLASQQILLPEGGN